jgi:hypothetical protein
MAEPQTESVSEILRLIWRNVLGDHADPESDFIGNGGDSFKAAVFSLRLLESTGRELDYVDVLGASSLSALTRTVEGHGHP